MAFHELHTLLLSTVNLSQIDGVTFQQRARPVDLVPADIGLMAKHIKSTQHQQTQRTAKMLNLHFLKHSIHTVTA